MRVKKLITTIILGLSAIICINAGNNQEKRKTPMTIEELLTMTRVGSFDLSPKKDKIVYTAGFPSIEKNKIQTKIVVVDRDGKNRTVLTSSDASQYSPVWIDGGSRIAFMEVKGDDMQVFSMMPDGKDIKQITNIQGGVSGFLFSPDEKNIVLIKDVPFDSHKGKNIHKDLPNTSGLVIDDIMYRHWDEWVETIPHIFIANYNGNEITEAKDILKGEPYEAPMKPFGGVEDISFSPDGKTIAYASRKKTGKDYAVSTNSDIYLYDIEKGTTKNITQGMMGYDTYPKFSPNGKYIAWIAMERDGYEADLKRLFIMDMKTGKKTYLTNGFEYDIDAICWKEDSKTIYFESCKEAEKNIFEIDIKKGKIRQITKGTHDYVGFSYKNGVMVGAKQSIALPTDIYDVDIKDGKETQITKENEALISRLASITVEKRWMKTTDGGNMLVWVVLPLNFDKTKKYPALLYCQGGPQSTISQFFSYRWNLRLMAEKGYVVVAPNRHGVPGFGKAWNEQISGDYPGQNMADYLTAIDEVAKEPWVDKEHLGCVGASYGGFSVYYLAGNSGDRFKALIAHNGIFNMEMQYMTTEEMWFANWDMGGAPWDKDNKVAQRTFANSPDKFVNNWKTPILVIHSGKDYRIDQSQGFAAFNTAKLKGVPAKFLYFPDENHWVLKMQNAVLWHRTFFDWLDTWLKDKK